MNTSDRIALGNLIAVIAIGVIGSFFTFYQSQIFGYQSALDNFPPKLSIGIQNYTFITNQTYVGYPLVQKISFSSASAHYLEFKISDFKLLTSGLPSVQGNPSEVRLSEPIIKYIDRGTTNTQFDIPFFLTFDVKLLPKYPSNVTLAMFSTSIRVQVFDIQNNATLYDKTLYSGLAINGRDLPKNYEVKVRDDIK